MLYIVKRHPFAVEAEFGHSLVLTYAFPEALLKPLLPPGLVLDAYQGWGFLAIALVETHHLRPSFLPKFMGQNFFLSGYRIFTRLGDRSSALRGLYILRSDTDRVLMRFAGNIFTHYRYTHCHARCRADGQKLIWEVKTPRGEADLSVTVDLESKPAPLPEGSPFADLQSARRFAGPLPYTFDYEAETKSIVSVRGIRKNWTPEPVCVHLSHVPSFLNSPAFRQVHPRLASAFHLQSVPYRWERGERIPIQYASS